MKDIAAALKFVKGAVAKKDYVPELTHFRIANQRIMGFNGKLALSHPIDLDLDVAPKAVMFERALAALPDGAPVAIDITGTRRLALRAAGFKVFVPTLDEVPEGLFVEPEGEIYPIDLDLVGVFNDVWDFIATDASRAWAQAVMLHENSAYATNNQIVIERWSRAHFPEPIVVPIEAVREIIRIGLEPSALQLMPNAAVFHYPNGAWLRTQFLNDPWPARLKEVAGTPSDRLVAVPENFAEEVKRISAFVEDSGVVYVKGNLMSTTCEGADAGASVELDTAIGDGSFHIDTLKKIASVATKVDLWGKPAVFQGKGVRGAAMPMVVAGGAR